MAAAEQTLDQFVRANPGALSDLVYRTRVAHTTLNRVRKGVYIEDFGKAARVHLASGRQVPMRHLWAPEAMGWAKAVLPIDPEAVGFKG